MRPVPFTSAKPSTLLFAKLFIRIMLNGADMAINVFITNDSTKLIVTKSKNQVMNMPDSIEYTD